MSQPASEGEKHDYNDSMVGDDDRDNLSLCTSSDTNEMEELSGGREKGKRSTIKGSQEHRGIE